MSDQRTEQATPQRKKKARESGDIVRSRELLSAAGMLAGLATMGNAAAGFVRSWRECYAQSLTLASPHEEAWGLRELTTIVRTALLPAAVPVAAVMGASFTAVLVIGIAQGGGITFSTKALGFTPERLSPLHHVKQMFSARTLIRLAKSLLPALVVAWMGYAVLNNMLLAMPVMSLTRLPQTFGAAYELGSKAAWVMVAWAGIDYAVEWRSWNQRLKMSKQEMREEIKEAIGNPQVKGKIRQMQRAMAKRKAKVDMKRASVVITNPTHYAVALEFDFDTMSAPTVLTKGRDLLALDIREEARWAGVPIIENPPLARSLYRAVEPGQSIPYELYAAVAGILAYLFREAQNAKHIGARDANRTQQETQDMAAQQSLVAVNMMGFEGGM